MTDCRWRSFLLALLIIASACGPLDDEFSEEAVNRQGFKNFQTAVASDRNYDIYWLGREFEAGSLLYKGPDVSDFADDVEGGGLGMHYVAQFGEFCCLDLHLVLYSQQAWKQIEEKRAAGPSPRFEPKTVQVAGRTAELRTNHRATGAVSSLILTIDFGDTLVEALTGSVVPATPGPEPNPLIDEATFLAVMEKLRPYPE